MQLKRFLFCNHFFFVRVFLSDENDIFQEVIVRLVRHVKDLQDMEHAKAWLIRGTINCTKKHFGQYWNKNVYPMEETEEAPHLTYSITDDGRPQFTWNEVEGAREYMVCKIWKTKGQEYANSLTVMEIVTDTTWTTELPEFSNATTVNSEFKTFLISEDGWKDESLYENHLERYGEPGIPHYSVEGGNVDESGICVIAVNDQGTSMISNYYAFTELAINQYLCDTIVYDEDALASAEEYNYMYVDPEFNDSFNAYGALIDGKCVCAGYAAAFKLLAQEAGLEAIVVTGYLDGNLSHTWNKVKIDDEWQIVDVTNNDNEYFFNALLNLPSSVGDRVLVGDKEYLPDKVISRKTMGKVFCLMLCR